MGFTPARVRKAAPILSSPLSSPPIRLFHFPPAHVCRSKYSSHSQSSAGPARSQDLSPVPSAVDARNPGQRTISGPASAAACQAQPAAPESLENLRTPARTETADIPPRAPVQFLHFRIFVKHYRSNRAICLPQRRPSVPAGRKRLRARQHKRSIQSGHGSNLSELVFAYPLFPQFLLNLARLRDADVPFVRNSQSVIFQPRLASGFQGSGLVLRALM